MVNIMIGKTERPFAEATPEWINQQIGRRRAAGESVCISVRIDEPGAVMSLTTQECPPGSSNNREPNPFEQRIFEVWQQYDLDKPRIETGKLISFLERLSRMI
jgi:hypothetical protein